MVRGIANLRIDTVLARVAERLHQVEVGADAALDERVGGAAARACVAFHPVRCAGTTIDGWIPASRLGQGRPSEDAA
jgi:hypothetical protein